MKKISILGSTGSIGANTLEVIRQFPGRFQVVGLAAGRNIELLRQQIHEFRPKVVSVAQGDEALSLQSELKKEGIEVTCGEEGHIAVATQPDADIVLSAMVGTLGFMPTLRALSAGKHVALANKETLVVAGPLISEEAHKNQVKLLPVDSEHSAIWQCLEGQQKDSIRKLILTASGGPFLRRDTKSFDSITVEEALDHPNWRMGKKITVDSATLMNKGLEMIEAHYLFDEPADKLEIIIHPQSVIHSMVEFVDGSVIAQLGTPDMKIPIQLALTYPERWENRLPSVDLTKVKVLEFFEPDYQKFPCLQLAREALTAGGTMTAVLNAANEVAVHNFLMEKLPFTAISHVVASTMERHHTMPHPDLEDILAADRGARKDAESFIAQMVH